MHVRFPIVPDGTNRRGFAAEDLGGAFLQAIDGGIFEKHVVADFGFRHRAAHFGGRFRYGVAS